MRAVSLLLALGLGSLLSDKALAGSAAVEGGVVPLAGDVGEDAGGHEPADRAGGETFAASGDRAVDFCAKIDGAKVRDQCYLEIARSVNCPGGWRTSDNFIVEKCSGGSSNTDSSEGSRSGDGVMDACARIGDAKMRDQCYMEISRTVNCPGGWRSTSEGDNFIVEECRGGFSNTDSSEGNRDADTGGGNSVGRSDSDG